MALILQVRADPNNIFKVEHFKNTENWIVHGSPIYKNDSFPEKWLDCFYLDSGSWLESPVDDTFNLYCKNFTITWWEYRLERSAAEFGSLVFSVGSPSPWTNTSLLLLYNGGTGIFARTAVGLNRWDILDGFSGGSLEYNIWNNYAFTAKWENGTHYYTFYKNGEKINSSSITGYSIANVNNKLFIGNYNISGGPNKYFQNIKMYDECLFDGVSSYDVQKYERWDHSSSRVISNLKNIETT